MSIYVCLMDVLTYLYEDDLKGWRILHHRWWEPGVALKMNRNRSETGVG